MLPCFSGSGWVAPFQPFKEPPFLSALPSSVSPSPVHRSTEHSNVTRLSSVSAGFPLRHGDLEGQKLL